MMPELAVLMDAPVPTSIAAWEFVPEVRVPKLACKQSAPVPANKPEEFTWTHWTEPVIPESVIELEVSDVNVPVVNEPAAGVPEPIVAGFAQVEPRRSVAEMVPEPE